MRSKRAASATCSWAAGRSITARRSRRCARRSWRLNGLTISCRYLRRCADALFAIGDEELLEYHQLARRFHPFRIPETLPPHLEPVRDALAFLATLHRSRNRRPVADTISALLDATRAHVGFVLRPGGEQALANVLHVAELARQYELDGGMSFRGFVETLQSEAATTGRPRRRFSRKGATVSGS